MSPKELRALEHALNRIVEQLVRIISEMPDEDPLEGEMADLLTAMQDAHGHVLDRLNG